MKAFKVFLAAIIFSSSVACNTSVTETSVILSGSGSENNSSSPTPSPTPAVLTSLFGIRMSNTWGTHSGACRIAEGDSLYCWGKSIITGDGLGASSWTFSPELVSGFETGVSAVSVGPNNVCAIKSGLLYCWGENANGETGTGTQDPVPLPTLVDVPGESFSDVIVGPSGQTCALTTLGALYCFGLNDSLSTSLGVGSTDNTVNVPTLVQGMQSGVKGFSIGDKAICAIKNEEVFCWGSNVVSELGTDTLGEPLLDPTSVPGLNSNVTKVSVSAGSYANAGNSICAIQSNAMVCLGQNDLGQLGDSSGSGTLLLPTPNITLTAMVSDILITGLGGCGIMDGEVYCWGAYTNETTGVVDYTAPTGNATPILVSLPASETFVSLQGQGNAFCAKTASLKEYCWGLNVNQALFSDGSNVQVDTPVEAGPF